MRRLVALLLCGCGSVGPPTPKPESVVPSRIAAGAAAMLTIKGRDFRPDISTDFGRAAKSTLLATFTVSLVPSTGAAIPLSGVEFVDTETLKAEVPATLPRDLYDVQVVDPRGQMAALPGALRVVTSAESVAAFQFDFIDPQRAGVPFAVGLTAVDEAGQNVEGFDGTAEVTAPGAAPVTLGPFALGRARGFVTVPMPATGVRVTASDALGHTGTSEPFDVTPGEAARVAFVEAPERFAAGACGGPFTVEVQDTFGNPAAPSAASPFAVSVIPPEGGELFTDSACGSTMSGGMLSGRATFFVRSTRAGRPQVRVVPEAWPSAARDVDVDAGAAVGLEIASAPQVLGAGMCSQAVVVRARDAFGNAAAVADVVALEVTATPSTGVTLHGDAACAAALNVLEIPDAGVEATFFFRSAVAQMVELSVDGGALGVAVQTEDVTP